MSELFVALCIFLSILIIKITFFKHVQAETSTGASLMAVGIFLNGAIYKFPSLNLYLGKYMTLTLFVIWVFFIKTLIQSFFKGQFMFEHVIHPIKSFAIGTWIASTSVCGAALYLRIPDFKSLIVVMNLFNCSIWFLYIGLCLHNFIQLVKRKDYLQAHGVILLTTVSTQSLVILNKLIMGGILPSLLFVILIQLGVVFYVVGFIFIFVRYCFSQNWTLEDDWQNTNCIIHGAMSITGLASILSKSISLEIIVLIWVWVLLWFIIIESIELWRALKRIQRFGLVLGIGTYNTSQWSRNFTFGMLYAFTLNLDLSKMNLSFLSAVQSIILNYGHWIVLILLINEFLLFVKKHVILKSFETQHGLGEDL